MYFLYILSNVLVVSTVIYKIFDICTRPNKKLKLIDESENENVKIKLICMKFYNENNKLIQKIENDIFVDINDSKKIDLSYYLFDYKHIVFYYYYKEKYYKWINKNDNKNNNKNDNKIVTFPFYNAQQYKKYVYTNKITQIYLDNTKLDDMSILIEPFLGPNYNFYIELDYSLYPYQILEYFNILYTTNSVMSLCDNFNNKIEFKMNDKLYWNPELKLN